MGIKTRLKNLIGTNTFPKNQQELSEDEYYTQLFLHHKYWNTPEPNYEEKLRWQIILNYIFYILGYHGDTQAGTLKILDLGCGRGWLSNLMSQYGEVTGIEPIKAVVNYGKSLFPKLNLLCGTIQDLPNNDEYKYDLIVCSEVIEHIPDENKSQFIKDITNLLNSKGFLIITTPRKDAQIEWLKYNTPGQPIEDWLSEAELFELFNLNQLKKHYLSRFSIPPAPNSPSIDIYQLWLVQKQV